MNFCISSSGADLSDLAELVQPDDPGSDASDQGIRESSG